MKQYPIGGEPIITQYYREDKYNPHYGIDFAVTHRTAIVSVANGSVLKLRDDETRNWLANTESDPFKPFGFPVVKRNLKTEDYGNYVKIDHGDNISTLYAHLDEVAVYNGQIVKEGELIGYSDNTGNSTGNHLHYELRINDKCVDPLGFYSKYPDFEGKGGVAEESNNFYPYKTVITVNDDVDTLYVRSNPAKMYPLSGSQKLTGGDTVDVVGFVKGERIEYDNISTQFWWKSEKGNYFWSGGTDLIPTLDNFPEGMKYRDNKLLEEINMEELKNLLKDLEVRKTEKELELKDIEAEMVRVQGELDKPVEVEEVVEEAVSEEPTPIEEEVVAPEVEVTEPEAEAVVEEAEEVAEENTEVKEQIRTISAVLEELKSKFL